MKYIKIFEDVSKGYEFVEASKWVKYANKNIMISKSLVNTLTKLTKEKNPKIFLKVRYSNPPRRQDISINYGIHSNKEYISIIECEDEWYCIIICDRMNKLSHIICDQEYGLLNLLREEGFIN